MYREDNVRVIVGRGGRQWAGVEGEVERRKKEIQKYKRETFNGPEQKTPSESRVRENDEFITFWRNVQAGRADGGYP